MSFAKLSTRKGGDYVMLSGLILAEKAFSECETEKLYDDRSSRSKEQRDSRECTSEGRYGTFKVTRAAFQSKRIFCRSSLITHSRSHSLSLSSFLCQFGENRVTWTGNFFFCSWSKAERDPARMETLANAWRRWWEDDKVHIGKKIQFY